VRYFDVGQSVARRDVHRGKAWSIQPVPVIQDDTDGLITACWPGVPSLVPGLWVQSMVTGDKTLRSRAVDLLATGDWTLEPWTWKPGLRQVP
jgi:hypothetical protein